MPKTTKIKGAKFKLPWRGIYKIYKSFNNNIVGVTIMGDDEIKKVNINKLKEYHSKIVVVNVIVANAYVERYPNKYHQNKSLITKPTNSFRLVPKPKNNPWIDSIHKIIYDEYFWVEEEKSISNEGKTINSHYKTQL